MRGLGSMCDTGRKSKRKTSNYKIQRIYNYSYNTFCLCEQLFKKITWTANKTVKNYMTCRALKDWL